MKRVFGLNFFDAFIAGATTVAVPLLLSDRGIDITSIGLIFAIAPLVKLVVRLFGAALADNIGERAIYSMNAVFNFAQAAAYAFSSSAPGFAAGKMFDGVRESLIFSVNRTSVISEAPQKEHFGLAGLMSGRFIYNALGSLAVGVLFAFGGFGIILALIAAISVFMLLASLKVKNHHNKAARVRLSDLSPFGRSKDFNRASFALVIGGCIYYPVVYLMIPLFFRSIGYGLAEIGTLYAAYFLINGATMNILSHRRAESGKLAFAGAAIFVLALAGMAVAPNGIMPYVFLFMAFGDACLGIIWEQVNYFAVRGSRRPSTDFAVVSIPTSLAIFAVTGVSGFLAASFGYAPLFILCALTEAGFAILALRLVKA